MTNLVYNVIQRSNGIALSFRAMPLRREIPDMEQVIDQLKTPLRKGALVKRVGDCQIYTGINKRCIKP